MNNKINFDANVSRDDFTVLLFYYYFYYCEYNFSLFNVHLKNILL